MNQPHSTEDTASCKEEEMLSHKYSKIIWESASF